MVTADRVIRGYFLVSGLYTLAAALIWGVNTLFLLDAGLDIFGVFVANGAYTAGMVVFEIPTGVLADTRGRRISFLFSVVILAVTTVAYVGAARMGGGLGSFVIVSVRGSLGYLARVRSIADGYVVGGLFTLLAIPVLMLLRVRHEDADRIVGERAGLRAACAAQGLPEVVGVDATPRRAVGP